MERSRVVGGRRRGVRVESRCRVHRTARHSFAASHAGRWRLQVRRRRKDLASRGAARDAEPRACGSSDDCNQCCGVLPPRCANAERGGFGHRWGHLDETLYRDDKSGGRHTIDPKNPAPSTPRSGRHAQAWGWPPAAGLRALHRPMAASRGPRSPGTRACLGRAGKIGSRSPGRRQSCLRIVEADSGGVFRSDDAGGTWR